MSFFASVSHAKTHSNTIGTSSIRNILLVLVANASVSRCVHSLNSLNIYTLHRMMGLKWIQVFIVEVIIPHLNDRECF